MKTLNEEILIKVIKKRKSESHKGNYGRLLFIGGNQNYGGAIIMASEAALNSGAGLICTATHSLNATALHARDPEIMFLDWDDKNQLKSLIPKMDVVICGMGLGTDDFGKKMLRLLQKSITPKQNLILDASALDLIGEDQSLLPFNARNIILTPHQMEWQRLSKIEISKQTDEANQVALNKLFPQKNAFLVLKSNHTKINDQQGHIFLNPLGNPGMATGGMGDTLAGIIGGFIGQFGGNIDTINAAVFIHSLIGDELYKRHYVVRPTTISRQLSEIMKKYENIEE